MMYVDHVDSRNSQDVKSLGARSFLQKRDDGPYNSIGGCDFPAGFQATQPGYLRKEGLINIGKQPNGNGRLKGQMINAVPKW